MSLFRRRTPTDADANGHPHEAPRGSDPEPVDGYDGLKPDKVIASLRGHSQAELAEIEDYERANANRQVVLDKLRYLRQDEPLAGYDELQEDGVAAALKDADHETLARVREYERKFKRRDAVLTVIANASAGSNGDDGHAVADDG
jgi:hypothetical protein